MKRILLFVHYNKSETLDDRVIYTLKEIRDLFDTIVVISNSKLSSEDRQTLGNLANVFMQRKNVGYDFSAWKAGLDKIGWDKLNSYDSLTLMNDTCHFPVLPISPYFKKFDKLRSIDFWGASVHKASKSGMPGTDGPIPEHIQSYFITFKKRVFVSKVFRDFWINLKDRNDLQHVIRDYETKLTGILSSAGFKYDAIINTKGSVFKDRAIINPLYQIPEGLLDQNFPFIKLKAVSKYNFINIRSWVKNNSEYPSSSINPYGTSKFLQIIILGIDSMLKKAHLTFLAISVPTIIAFALITPMGFGGDEAAHVYKSYSISQGHLFSVESNVPKNLSESVEYGWKVAGEAPWGSQIYGRHDIGDDAAKQLEMLGDRKLQSYENQEVTYYGAATYPATVYAGAVLGIWIGDTLDLSVQTTLLLARLLNAIPFLLFGASALYILRASMAKWLVFMVLLVPTVLSYAATVNGDPYNIAVVMLFFALFLQCIKDRHKITKKYQWFLATASVLLALAKVPSVLLVGLLLFIPSNRFGSSKEKWIKIGAMVTTALLLTITITYIGYEHLPYRANSSEKISWILSNPIDAMNLFFRTIFMDLPDYINRSVGVIGRNGVFIHQTIILTLFVWLTVLALSVEETVKKKGMLLLGYASLLCLIVIGLLFTGDPGNKIGQITIWGVHGKYFTPFIPIIFYGLGAMAPFKIVQNKNYVGLITIILMVFVTITSVLTYTTALY